MRQADGQEIRQALSWQQQQQLLIEEFFIAEEIALKMPRDDTGIAWTRGPGRYNIDRFRLTSPAAV